MNSRKDRSRHKRRWHWRSLLRWLLIAVLAFLLANILMVAGLRWVNPPTTAFVVQHNWAAFWSDDLDRARRQWVGWDDISPQMALAVIAAEDQRFPRHRGFDMDSIADAVADYRRTGRVRGASTISQQTAKNLFLWPGRSLFRKGIEAGYTVLIEGLWPKQRILEVYLNVAQFGPDIYGVEAASQAYFGKPASQLTAAEAALMAAVLPNPVRFRVDRPSEYVRGRQQWIQRQMRQLGDTRYLEQLAR
ncbi:monofunctional biosynthetic peptidoglycan transglycosylase [Natronocella acetinitrilica]|jgi:monofunctional glycosyltransferase|uniref:Biosynthetic peptidoglycan transglycosylase n=1 Tax=Natronocella acetinitrilica TaxID=414046 RepID=A0AAE3G0N2_9GAMM|nr:monofunctional biosynthetic peptidoglycan transglycosylase [Natronocella acetinitrilica]MCP1673275.1 monofunctional biosynthetic peptidoglycan transglycosylase [Natronocella acetinitrilica]